MVSHVKQSTHRQLETAGKVSTKGKNLAELEKFGDILDRCPECLRGGTVGVELIEQLLRVRTRSGGIAALKANAVQRAFEARRGQRNIVLKARQLGLTTWTAARFFLRTITRPGTLTLQVAHTQQAAEEIFRIVHRFYEWLPDFVRNGALATSQLNARQMVFRELDSEYRVVTAGDRNAGRGLTVQNLHCSELARWPGDAAETLAGLRAALSPDAEVILESTPDGVGGCFHDEWRNAEQTGVVRHFFPWWMELRYVAPAVEAATLTEDEQELIVKQHLTLEQIGYRRQIRASFQGLARQEYAEDADSCFLASGDSYFDVAAVDARLQQVRNPVDREHNGELEIWLPAQPGKRYLLGVDPAGGGSEGDYSAIEVIDFATGLQCAEFAGHMGGLELARYIAELAQRYNHAWVAVERNNIGSGVLAYLESSCKYEHLYRQSGQLGWLTSSLTRPAALNKLSVALVNEAGIIQSRRLLDECRTFVRLPNGGMGARVGAHDDRVMAMSIALAAREEMLSTRVICI